MKAIGFKQSLPIDNENSFIAFETDRPAPRGSDLLVKVKAVAVNPIDYKIRQNAAKDTVLEQPKVIGWDAVGTVEAVGKQVTRFQPGDRVFYAGSLNRSGCNVEYQLVDERIVGPAPKNLSDAEAAAIPLTGLTAYESLFDRIRINPERTEGKTVLILAGAGGVGSIAIQLVKALTDLTVIATASREVTREWCKKMGADKVINHQNDIRAELERTGVQEVDYVLDFVDLQGYWSTIAEIIKPQGHIVSITGGKGPVDLDILKVKSVSFSWELMYTRSMFHTDDMARQHDILKHLSEMLNDGTLQTTVNTVLEGFTVENLKKAHRLQESGTTIGKTVIVY
jgi:NADPH:quinone reductase